MKKKKRSKRSYWTKTKRNLKHRQQKTGEGKAQGGLVSDAQREVLLVRCKFISDLCASCGLVFPRVVML